MSGPKHSVTIQPVGRPTGDDPRTAYQASCLCGWAADQTYSLHSRAARAYYRHVGRR